ncbi:MAG: signal peptide peptidase SppA [Bacteroidales bacterium]
MKQFFKMMFASTLGALLGAGLLVLILFFGLIGMAATMGSGSGEYVPKKNTVLKLSLNGAVCETAEENLFDQLLGNTYQTLSLRDILKSIRIAKADDRIRGIYLECNGSLSAGVASIDIIRRELLDFKESGKFVVAYGDIFSQGEYYLCSVADKVLLNPSGRLMIRGLTSDALFLKGFLNKLGIDMTVFKVGAYKGAVEPFTLDKFSEANRQQIVSRQQRIWGNITQAIAGSRRHLTPQDINAFADSAWFFAPAEKTVALGFVDSLTYKPDAEEYVKTLAGQTGDKLKTAGWSKIKNIKTKEQTGKDKIVVLYAEGEITDDIIDGWLGEKSITNDLAEELVKLRKDEDVKAVVLRVNSPGGSAVVSEQIWKQMDELHKEKPVVVSMGDVAASGGYYISCAASKIVAEPNTITGSIGIFGLIPNAAGLFKKLDLTADVVQTNRYGDLLDPSRPVREDEKRIMQAYIERGYDLFLTRCADGRGKTKAEIDRIGQGRVWTGEQAHENGLVDALGGIDEAVKAAAELANLNDYELVSRTGNKDFIREFLEKQFDDLKAALVKSVAGEEYKFLKELKRLKQRSGVLALLPYDVKSL